MARHLRSYLNPQKQMFSGRNPGPQADNSGAPAWEKICGWE